MERKIQSNKVMKIIHGKKYDVEEHEKYNLFKVYYNDTIVIIKVHGIANVSLSIFISNKSVEDMKVIVKKIAQEFKDINVRMFEVYLKNEDFDYNYNSLRSESNFKHLKDNNFTRYNTLFIEPIIKEALKELGIDSQKVIKANTEFK